MMMCQKASINKYIQVRSEIDIAYCNAAFKSNKRQHLCHVTIQYNDIWNLRWCTVSHKDNNRWWYISQVYDKQKSRNPCNCGGGPNGCLAILLEKQLINCQNSCWLIFCHLESCILFFSNGSFFSVFPIHQNHFTLYMQYKRIRVYEETKEICGENNFE